MTFSPTQVEPSAEELDKFAARVLTHVRSNRGQRLEEIERALRTDTGVLECPTANFLAARKLKSQGQKRGTKYFPRPRAR